MTRGKALEEVYKMRDTLDQAWAIVARGNPTVENMKLREKLEFSIYAMEELAERIDGMEEERAADD